jgi:hypothetical protein
MAGIHAGVQKRVRDLQPKAIYVHCHNHLLNLALQEASTHSVRGIRDILMLVNDLANFFRDSAKRTGILKTIISDICEQNSTTGTKLHPICPTRWVVRARAFSALLNNFEAVTEALDTLSNEPGPTGAKAEGFSHKLRSFESLLYITVANKVFSIVKQLATVLQKKTMTLSAARECVSVVKDSLKSMRCESEFTAVWSDVSHMAEKLKLLQPKLPRYCKLPTRNDDGGPAHHFSDPVSYHRAETWFAFIDTITTQIDHRFASDSFQQICNAEDLLIKAATAQPYKNELQQFLVMYDDFDYSSLQAQLTLLHSAVSKHFGPENTNDRFVTVAKVADILKNTPGAQQLLDQVCQY